MSAARAPRTAVTRTLLLAGKALSYGVLFAVLLCVGALLHLDVPIARKFAAKALSDGLATLFEGKIVLTHVDDLGVSGLRGADAHVTAPDGSNVIVAHGIRARIDPMALVRTVFAGRGVIGVFDIEIDDAEVVLDEDGKGSLKIARAFEFTKPLPPPDGKKAPFQIDLAAIHVRHVWIHGFITGAPILDGDADDVHGEVHIADSATVLVSHLDLRTRGAPAGANAVGVVQGYVVLPSPHGNFVGVGGTFDGLVGQIPARAHLDLDDRDWRASFDVPQVDTAKVRAMIPSAPLYGPLSLHADANGPLDALLVHAHAKLGASDVDVRALLALPNGVSVDAHVEASDVDLRDFAPGAPASRLGTNADVQLRANDGETLHGTFALTTPEGTLDAHAIPATDLHGTFERRAPSTANDPGLAVTAVGEVLEPGAPTHVSLVLHPGAGGPAVDVDAHTVVPSLGGVRRIGWLGAGRAEFTTKGVITISATPRFDANVRAAFDGFRRDDVRVAHASVAGHASGTFGDPAFESTIDATNVRADHFTWDHATATASGSRSSFGVTLSAHGVEGPSVEGQATVSVAAVTTITDADLTLRRSATAMHAHVGKVRAARGLLLVDNAEVTGVGEPLRGSFGIHRGVLAVHAESAGLDLGAVAYLFCADDHLKKAHASFALDVRSTGARAEGTASVQIKDLQWDAQEGIAVRANARLHDREIVGTASASVPGLGELYVRGAVIHVGGTGPIAESSWRSSWGDVSLDGKVDLARAVAMLPPGTLPPMDVGGTIEITAHTSRASATDGAPTVALSLQTRGLWATAHKPPVLQPTRTTGSGLIIVVPPAWEVRGLEAAVDVNVKGGTGQIAARVTDPLGPLVSIDAHSAKLPYAELVGPDGMAALLRQPMTAHVHVPPRELLTLPPLIRPDSVRGYLQVDATVTGSARAPVIKLDAVTRSATFAAMPDGKPLDILSHGTYAAKAGDFVIDVSSPYESHAHLRAHVNADLGAFIAGGRDPGWNGSARGTLVHFPLGAIGQLSDRDVRGRVSGEVVLTRFHDDARATVKLEADRFSVGRARFPKAALEAAFDGHTLDAHARLDEKDGFAEATAKMAMTWGAALSPKPASDGALAVTLVAKHLQASFLEPLLASTFDELDGIIDGDARFTLAVGKEPAMSGSVLLHDAHVIPTATGEELHGINANVTLAEDGTLSLTDFVARGTTGKVTGSGGAHFSGMSLTDATLKLGIAKKDALPLSLGGSVLGTGYGVVTLGASNAGGGKTKVTVDIPTFHIELPESTPRTVQDLDPPPDNLHVGVYTAPREFKLLGKARDDAAKKKAGDKRGTLEIAIHLGAVEVRRGTDLRALLGGDTTMAIADKTTMHGEIVLQSGKLAVQGKPFEIQRGTATFVGDPQNPEVDLTASWKAGDGTEVFADYVGPLKTGKVVLRSEPPRPQNEIISLILFGTSDGAQSTPYAQQQPTTDSTTQVGSAVGGFATGGLNQGIDKLTGIDIATKVNTSGANPRPEVELRIARDLSLQLAFVLGTPPPGTNQDTTYATIDWRFYRSWSLATTFGNLGSSMADILWRYRY